MRGWAVFDRTVALPALLLALAGAPLPAQQGPARPHDATSYAITIVTSDTGA